MTRRRAAALLPVCAIALVGAAPVAPVEGGVKIVVNVTELRNAKGVVRACMTSDRAHFPHCRGIAGTHFARVDAHEGALTVTFTGVEPGRYAIALLHDENDNGKADRALGMMPTEGFGFSRDAKVRMGPPEFDDAVFDVDHADRRMTIRMRYML